MAVLELNALSTALSGSFSATVFFPDQPRMEAKNYPALYFLHDIGGNDTDLRPLHNLEALCNELGLFVICPALMHSFGMDLPWGGKYGDFVRRELPGICRHLFPLDPLRQYVGGTGGGAYGAYWNAANHPEAFTKCMVVNGRFDAAALCEAAARGEALPHLTRPNLEAVFGDLQGVRGSGLDILRPGAPAPKELFIGCEEDFPALEDSLHLANRCKTMACLGGTPEALWDAGLRWLCDERKDCHEKN